jgi:hypothetical protein
MITNYISAGNPALIDSTSVTVPVKVFTSTTTGAPIGGGVTGQTNAITTIALCNTAAATLTDETANAVIINIYLVKSGESYGPGNLIVSNLTVPAGETVFFSEERIVLDAGDEIWVGTSVTSRLSVTISSLPV